MSFIDLGRTPSARELWVFGLLLPLFFGVVGGLVGWKSGAWPVSTGIWIAGGAVTLAYWGVRSLRWPLYALWMRAAFPMGWAVSNLALAVIFYGVFTPYGIVMRLFGRDKLQLAIDRNAPTYWAPVEPVAEKARYFKQS